MLTNTYGCPLHSKTDYAKADWTVWTAALQNDRLMFREFLLPLYNQKTRVTSWGRPVTGAYFIKLLEAVLDEKGNNIVSKDEMNCSK